MASEHPKSEAVAYPDFDVAEIERRRKQRELKRKSRERKKKVLLELQTTAQTLEHEYSELFAAKRIREQHDLDLSGAMKIPSGTTKIKQPQLAKLQEKYKAVRREMYELREQMSRFKQQLEEYERFVAMLDGHLTDVQTQQRDPATSTAT
ncbi:uncharacterized protein PHALS_06915 [Plasmopara halstedii]|uniref:Uncharacterized protein n=1 Tax=Plasmopara halstedii TaxID=4781 RepID=A0A0P1B2Y2_PLAHL|nr:uncharacterized protein PHALS_06915 [Plasmopara halstedii]CEG49135.1 hypothetical protein PHALS_06915 [Plasmopara halstedii]|eukprot:XP_024585504.1 hypothetical protein PHALS_06915 [Plasmopara halstedii]